MTAEERKMFIEMSKQLAVITSKFEDFSTTMKEHTVSINSLERVVNNGLCEKLKDLSQEFAKHLEDTKNYNGKGRRKTDLNNRSKPVKWGIIIGVIGLVLGNLAMLGYVFTKIGEWLLQVPK